ncbi:MAG: hypothetical protein AABW79_04260 [Nanoarchaeota archaeon]
MQIKLLKDLVGVIANPTASPIIDLLYGKKNVNEFIIAKKLGLNINQTRNILYKLADEGLVSFVGKKDRKNGGWYTYYWTLDVEKSFASLKRTIGKNIAELENQLKIRTSERHYHCVNCDVEMNEEQALLANFACPECGEVLQLREPAELIADLERQIIKARSQLEIVSSEFGEVSGKNASLRARASKRAAVKAKAERSAKMKAKKLLLAKTIKKPVKKSKGKAKKK